MDVNETLNSPACTVSRYQYTRYAKPIEGKGWLTVLVETRPDGTHHYNVHALSEEKPLWVVQHESISPTEVKSDHVKLNKVRGFEKELGAFAILMNDKQTWSAFAIWGNYDPILFKDKEGNLGSIAWETRFERIFENPSSQPFDESIIKGAEEVKEGNEVVIPPNFFLPPDGNLNLKNPGTYHEKEDVYVIPGPKPANKSVHLGQGVYFLLDNNEVIGLVLKDAKKKYEEARVPDPVK